MIHDGCVMFEGRVFGRVLYIKELKGINLEGY